MQRLWSAEELGEHWTLGAEDLVLLSGLSGEAKTARTAVPSLLARASAGVR